MTLVVVTHDNRIFPFADRILRLEDGRLSDDPGEPERREIHASELGARMRLLKERVA